MGLEIAVENIVGVVMGLVLAELIVKDLDQGRREGSWIGALAWEVMKFLRSVLRYSKTEKEGDYVLLMKSEK